ncbi:MAG: mechanosensitive ion channel [Thiothrix sp.]|nr:mechanosensitive ion channel [Thiothrix sp.]
MDLNAKQEQLHLLYVWITQWVLGPGILLQICIILLCLGLATWISRQLSQKITMPKSFHKNHPILQLSWRIVLSMIFPLSLLFLLGLIMLGYKTMGVPYQLLQKTANIAMAWALILFGSTFIRNVFFSRLVAILIISITTLHMLGYLQLTINWLDGLKLGSEKNSLSVYDLISSTFSIAAFVWGALFLSNQLDNALRHKSDMSLSTKALLGKLVKFLLVAFAFLIGLHTVGIDLTAFAFFGGAVAVGIGLGLQKVFSNLIAGIILLSDKSIKPGDTIVVAGRYGKVDHLSARYVSMITRDGREFLIPNDELINNMVENWSYSDENVRLKIPLSVHYQSDLNLAIQLCLDAARETPRVIKFPKPACLLKGFGDNSVNLELRIWVRDPMNGCSNVKSEVMLLIWEKFHTHDIRFPYPQRDIHIRTIDTALQNPFSAHDTRGNSEPPWKHTKPQQ